MTQLSFQMPIKLEEVDPMVVALKAALEGLLAHEALVRFEICVSEALSNLVKHADITGHAPASDITILPNETGVDVDIHDPVGAERFDIKAHAKDLAGIDPTSESGRGLGLILECADFVSYGQERAGNRLRLRFQNRLDA